MNAVRRLDVTKHCLQTLVFNDSASGTSSRNLYFMYECVASNGSVLANPYTPVTIDYWIDFQYEDA